MNHKLMLLAILASGVLNAASAKTTGIECTISEGIKSEGQTLTALLKDGRAVVTAEDEDVKAIGAVTQFKNLGVEMLMVRLEHKGSQVSATKESGIKGNKASVNLEYQAAGKKKVVFLSCQKLTK